MTFVIFGLLSKVVIINFFSGEASRILADTLVGIYSVSAAIILFSRVDFLSV